MEKENDLIWQRYLGEVNSPQTTLYARERIHWICQMAKGKDVLDIGCSQGITSVLLGREGFNVDAIDVNDEGLKYAKEKLEQELNYVRENVHFINSDIFTYKPDKLYDTIILGEVIEHFAAPINLLRQAKELLKEEGRIIITVPFGLHEHSDHKTTFYMYNFWTLIKEEFVIEEFFIKNNNIYFCGSPKKNPSSIFNEKGVEELAKWMKQEEDKILEIQRNYNQKDSSFRQRIIKLESNQEVAKLRLQEQKDKIQEYKKEIERHEKRYKELEQLVNSNTSKEVEDIQKLIISKEGIIAKNQELIKQEEEELQLRIRQLKEKNNEIKQLKKYEKLIACMKMNIRYRIGDLFIDTLRHPWKFFSFPFRVYHLKKEANRGQLPVLFPVVDNNVHKKEISKLENSKQAILFLPTNGAGLGHLTRTLAIARRLHRLQPDREIIFLTTSPAINLIMNEGFTGYYLQSKMIYKEDITANNWNSLLKEHLELISQLHDIDTIVFDGALPYASILQFIRGNTKIKKIWVKRGMAKEGTKDAREEKEAYFDKVIVPGESGIPKITFNDNKVMCDPIIYLDKEELLDREQVRKLFKVPQDKKLVYIQLGAGKINDINSDIGIIVAELRRRGDCMILLGESIIGDRLDIYEEDIIIVKDYPNSRYCNGFDYCISAVGYNSFHEMMYFNVPTIFIPNMNTKTDDQYLRAMMAEKGGWGVCIEKLDAETFNKAVDKVMQIKLENSSQASITNGAYEAAELIIK